MDNQLNITPPPQPQDKGQQPQQQSPGAEQPKERILSDMSETPVAPEQLGSEVPHTIDAGNIHTMPHKFIDTHHAAVKVRAVSGRRLLIIVAIVAIVLGAITVGAYFYFQSPGTIFSGGTPQQPAPVSDQNNANQNTAQPPSDVTAPEDVNANVAPPLPDDVQATDRDAERVADIIEIARALDEYKDRFSLYPQFLTLIPKDILAVLPSDPLSSQPYTYTTKDNRQTYAIVFDVEEQAEFKGEILDKGTWELIPDDFRDDIPITTNTNQAPPSPPPPDPAGNAIAKLDADGDGLTTAEERALGTSAATHDSDADGFRDNIEIENFYSPIHSGDVQLDQSGIVKLFTNATNGFSFYYPSGWVVSVPDADQREVLISTGTGEDISITVDDNPEQLTSWEWYSETISFSSDTNAVTFVEIAGHEAVRTLDTLRVYVAVGDTVLSIVYNLNDVPTINYPNIFNLILDRLTIL